MKIFLHLYYILYLPITCYLLYNYVYYTVYTLVLEEIILLDLITMYILYKTHNDNSV